MRQLRGRIRVILHGVLRRSGHSRMVEINRP
jgi:hypothetical protein